ncbi:glycosyltransferase family protein [Aegicerativicinus sediminis]|uniref:hypothetical protein n=1 Tax=Aegicerativicinus sediminis TaxID=2893202 RepID=UPI001E64A5B3|nr:hypothetical protein [Aegicerativicinus sediminis]
MNTILIIYPHWHPANLAGVHRPRLIGNYLKALGWRPRVLTVNERYFEEEPDPDFYKTFSEDFEVTRVKALKVGRPRIFGDIGLRAFWFLYKKALFIIQKERIDFVWLPIPSFYNALLGRLLFEKTKIPYGIDYIDPWVRDITNQNNFRAKISQTLARILEPIALKKVSVISGVSTPYYEAAIGRNFPEFYKKGILQATTYNRHTGKKITHVAMPYGFDPNDHKVQLETLVSPWENATNKKIWIYAGAFLPNSHFLLDVFFESISDLRKEGQWDESIELWFIGTGMYSAKRIGAYAKDHFLQDVVFEIRERFPFLQVLNFLSRANTVMIIGSTEKHYTASKTFQALYSGRPILSVFHEESSALEILEQCNAALFNVKFNPNKSRTSLVKDFKRAILARLRGDSWSPNYSPLQKYSAKVSATALVLAIEEIL